MTEASSPRPKFQQIAWHDLTVPDADSVRDFYQEVVGWKPSPVDMGGYSDYSMLDADGNAVAGVCHAQGDNAGIPPQWMMYVTVENVESSIEKCLISGGRVVHGPRSMGGGRMAIIADPAGASLALFEVD